MSAIDIIARGLAVAAGSLRRKSIAVPLDPSLGWDTASFNPGTITLRHVNGRLVGDCAIRPRDFFPAYKAGTLPILYVSASGGSDTTGTGAAGAPYATLDKVFQVINAAGVPYLVRMSAGTYPRTTAGNAHPLTVSGCVLEAYGGQVVITTHDASLVWTANATYGWVSQAARNSVGCLLDLTTIQANGLYPELKSVGSLAECARQPGSYYADGTTLYVYHPSGAPCTQTNTRVLLNVPNLRLTGTTQISFLMTGQNPGDGFEVQGGATAFYAYFTGGAGGPKVVLGFEHCKFRYASAYSAGNTQPNAFGIEGVNGLVFCFDCDASAGGNDNWNPHNVLGVAAMHLLLLNCTSRDAGRFGSNSSNGVTWHEAGIKILDIGGDHQGARGWTFYGIGSGVAQLIGTRVGGSLGDRPNAGGFDPCEIGAGNTSIVTGDFVQIMPTVAGAMAAATTESGTITLRNPLPFVGQLAARGGAITVQQ